MTLGRKKKKQQKPIDLKDERMKMTVISLDAAWFRGECTELCCEPGCNDEYDCQRGPGTQKFSGRHGSGDDQPPLPNDVTIFISPSDFFL